MDFQDALRRDRKQQVMVLVPIFFMCFLFFLANIVKKRLRNTTNWLVISFVMVFCVSSMVKCFLTVQCNRLISSLLISEVLSYHNSDRNTNIPD